jgi:hypothetical protein
MMKFDVIDLIVPLYVRFLFFASIAGGLIFTFSIVRSILVIRAKRRHNHQASQASQKSRAAYSLNVSCLAIILVLLAFTCYYFTLPAEEMMHQYAKENPGSYEIVREARDKTFRFYLYFSIPSISIGIISLALIKNSSEMRC